MADHQGIELLQDQVGRFAAQCGATVQQMHLGFIQRSFDLPAPVIQRGQFRYGRGSGIKPIWSPTDRPARIAPQLPQAFDDAAQHFFISPLPLTTGRMCRQHGAHSIYRTVHRQISNCKIIRQPCSAGQLCFRSRHASNLRPKSNGDAARNVLYEQYCG
ncbi:MAG: hypothetical protein Q8O79_00010 [Pseudomonadota bacterium]|nr:hypothetical protein [Pseudomonadota bacterium]